MSPNEPAEISLPKDWKPKIKSAVLDVVALAQLAVTSARGRVAGASPADYKGDGQPLLPRPPNPRASAGVTVQGLHAAIKVNHHRW